MRLTIACLLAMVLVGCGSATGPADVAGPLPEAPGCPVLPADSVWRTPVADLDVHPRSDEWVAAIGVDAPAHPDFGSGEFDGGPIGIPYDVVGADQPRVDVTFDIADESDPGPYPIPDDATIEGGPDADGDRHVLVVDRDACTLYELYDARPADGGWTAGSGAVFDLTSNALRPEGWTSADAAGLPILPGLVRYDEVAAGVIDHALRITAPRTDRRFVWPARHQAGAADDPSLPPMGTRFRLSADVDPADFDDEVRPIVVALQEYGAMLADNGSPWFLSGVPDPRWDDDALRALRQIPGSAWEAVDVAPLQVADGSAASRQDGASPAPDVSRGTGRLAGDSRVDTAVAISRRQFPDGASTAYLARADVVVDAVAGGVLTDGPILLVPACGALPDVVAEEIGRLDPEDVIALGGEAAICAEVLEAAATSAPGDR